MSPDLISRVTDVHVFACLPCRLACMSILLRPRERHRRNGIGSDRKQKCTQIQQRVDPCSGRTKLGACARGGVEHPLRSHAAGSVGHQAHVGTTPRIELRRLNDSTPTEQR